MNADMLVFRTLHNTARMLKNAISEEVVAIERRPGGAQFSDVQHVVAGARGRVALEQGDVDGGMIAAGQVIGLIEDIPTCAERIERMVANCRQHLKRALSLMV